MDVKLFAIIIMVNVYVAMCIPRILNVHRFECIWSQTCYNRLVGMPTQAVSVDPVVVPPFIACKSRILQMWGCSSPS